MIFKVFKFVTLHGRYWYRQAMESGYVRDTGTVFSYRLAMESGYGRYTGTGTDART